ncbi:transposase [Streptomyces sp. NBC_00271]|uniref:transposase n=1 Tax=Streptomyces sp. NBC_00271 TaxID=2975697 RepID=UPI002E28D2AD|nr:transposase [Streptomyces sp. NBC_00271]
MSTVVAGWCPLSPSGRACPHRGLADDQAPSRFRAPEQAGAVHPDVTTREANHRDDPTAQHLLQHGSSRSGRGRPGRGHARRDSCRRCGLPAGEGPGHGVRSATAAGYRRPLVWARKLAFAALCGVSPIEYSSGRRTSRRLNHGGDRQANAALHRIVFTRLRVAPRTQAYYERRTQKVKTCREIIRCLKRYAAREAFNLVRMASSVPPL